MNEIAKIISFNVILIITFEEIFVKLNNEFAKFIPHKKPNIIIAKQPIVWTVLLLFIKENIIIPATKNMIVFLVSDK